MLNDSYLHPHLSVCRPSGSWMVLQSLEQRHSSYRLHIPQCCAWTRHINENDLKSYLFIFIIVYKLPVISVIISGAGCGVFVIPDQPVEVLVTPDADCFHFFIRHITAICIEVPQNHDVLYGYAHICFINCFYVYSCFTNFMHGISIHYVHPKI